MHDMYDYCTIVYEHSVNVYTVIYTQGLRIVRICTQARAPICPHWWPRGVKSTHNSDGGFSHRLVKKNYLLNFKNMIFFDFNRKCLWLFDMTREFRIDFWIPKLRVLINMYFLNKFITSLIFFAHKWAFSSCSYSYSTAYVCRTVCTSIVFELAWLNHLTIWVFARGFLSCTIIQFYIYSCK